MSWFTDLLKALSGAWQPRQPRSGNGASSFHLTWEVPVDRSAVEGFVEVSAVLEILVPPSVPDLHFWALQVDFAASGRALGGAHTGLQWNPRYAQHKAVNWGGYASAERGGFVLSGTRSRLDGFSDDPNTLAYAWHPGRPYRLRVFRSPELQGAWRSEVTDLSTGRADVVRDILPQEPPGDTETYLLRPVVWSEVFADCGAPSVTVRWSDLRAVDRIGRLVRPQAVLVNYQTWEAGGCPNTTAALDESGGLLQITNTTRRVQQGARLSPSGD
jgi:hypothetical protein